MGYLEKLKKEPRIVLSVLNVIFLLFPWISVSSSFELFGYTEEVQKVSSTGFELVGNSLLMIVVLLLPILFIAMMFFPKLQKYGKIIYLLGSVIAIVFILVVSAHTASSSFRGEDYDLGIKISVHRGIGVWMSLLSYLGIMAATLIIDFRVNKDVIKEKGLKGAFSEVAGQVSNSASEIASNIKNINISMPASNTPVSIVTEKEVKTVSCPSCSVEVPAGAAFCSKCGAKLTEAKKCSGCGIEIPEGASFCSECESKFE